MSDSDNDRARSVDVARNQLYDPRDIRAARLPVVVMVGMQVAFQPVRFSDGSPIRK